MSVLKECAARLEQAERLGIDDVWITKETAYKILGEVFSIGRTSAYKLVKQDLDRFYFFHDRDFSGKAGVGRLSLRSLIAYIQSETKKTRSYSFTLQQHKWLKNGL